MAIAGFMCILLGLCFSVVALLSLYGARSAAPAGPEIVRLQGPEGSVGVRTYEYSAGRKLMIATMVAVSVAAPVLLGLMGTAFGWLAFGRIRASKGRQYGIGLALFDGLFYPVLFGLFLFVIMPLQMIGIAMVVAVIVGIVMFARRMPARA